MGVDYGVTTSSFGLWDRNKTFKQFPIIRMLPLVTISRRSNIGSIASVLNFNGFLRKHTQ